MKSLQESLKQNLNEALTVSAVVNDGRYMNDDEIDFEFGIEMNKVKYPFKFKNNDYPVELTNKETKSVQSNIDGFYATGLDYTTSSNPDNVIFTASDRRALRFLLSLIYATSIS